MTLNQYFSLVDIQAKMALKSEASRYFFGYLWWILEPLLYVAVFYVVFEVILGTRRADFLVFLMCGKLPFVWFSKSVTQASSSIISNSGLIGRINVPKSLFPMATVQEGLYKQSTVFLLLFTVLILHDYSLSLTWLWLIPLLLVNYLMVVGCAFVGAVLVCFFRDFTMFISLGMVFLMFTSGIFWDVRALDNPEMTALVLTYNPMAFILDAYRQVMMYGTAPDVVGLLQVGSCFGALIAMMVLYMRRHSELLALKALTV